MTTIDVKYTPGTIKNPQHTQITEPAFIDTDGVHFPNGRLSALPKAVLSSDDPSGACRSIFAFKRTGTNIGSFRLYGTHTRLYARKNGVLRNITPIHTATHTNLGTNPFTTVNGSAVVTVAHTAHGFTDGDRIKIANVGGAVNGIPNTDLNKEHIITYVGVDSYTITVATAATSSGVNGGGGISVYGQIAAGGIDQNLYVGVGAGVVGAGVVGRSASSTTETFPRIWSFATFGNDVVMCPGDYYSGDGQSIYIWDGDLDVAPTVLTNAPTDCNFVQVVNNSIVALCGDTIKISAYGEATTWSGLSYYANQVQRVWKLISCRNIGTNAAVIQSPTESFLLQWVGEPNLWDLSDLNPADGIIAPMAACTLGGVLYWMGNTGMFAYDGGQAAVRLENSQNGDWILENMNNAQRWKIFLMTDEIYEQFYIFFPSGSGKEPTDYVIAHPQRRHFTLGKMNRTAAQLPGFVDSQFVMANGTSASAGEVYRHFILGGATDSWYAKTSYAYASDGKGRASVQSFTPDSYQGSDITLAMYGKEHPQGSEVDYGSWTITQTTTIQSVKAAGKLISLKLSGTGDFTIGAWKMTVEPQ